MQNYKKLSDLLGNDVCKGYVNKLLHQNPSQIALKYRDKIPCDASVLAHIIKLYQKALIKLPLWVENHCMLTTKSYEQSTSQTVALYKSTFLQGKKLLVLGGGLGVDEWAFSKSFSTIHTIDNDAELNKCVAYNAKILGIRNVERITQTAEAYVQNLSESFDYIYTDPDRRDENEGRVKTLQNSTPNILALLPKLFEHTNKVIVKASPLIDISLTIKQLKNVFNIKVIAVNNEVKEVLFFLQKEYLGNIAIEAANYNPKKGWQTFSFKSEQTDITNETVTENYFYEPNYAIIKAGISHYYAESLKLSVIDKKTFYYSSAEYIENFMGRSFKIVRVLDFNKKGISNYLKQENIKQANIAKRNFRLTVDNLKKIFGIKDGGKDYLFFTQKNGKPKLYHCIKT